MHIPERLKRLIRGLPPRVKMATKYVGHDMPVFVIAEVGINHNGSLELAKKLIDAAVEAGADAVKFQKRQTSEILTKEGLDRPYTSPHAFAPTYGAHRDKLEFSEEDYFLIKSYCKEKGILFFASVWDHKSADFMDRLDIAAYKIPSADTTNIPLLEYVAQKNKPMLLSTGMNTFDEIHEAVQAVLRHNDRVIIFHCLSLYPAPEDKLNMAYMDFLREAFHPLPVGYSGHEIDLLPTLAAVSRGATIVERHLTLDKKMKGSDHAASLEPHQFKELVDSIRHIEAIMGRPERVMYDELIPLREKLAKSVVSKREIRKGEILTKDMLGVKGPGTGIKPSQLNELIGRVAARDIPEDVLLPVEALRWNR